MTRQSQSAQLGKAHHETGALSTLMNGWPLFFWISAVMTLFMFNAMSGLDLTTPEGVSQMIQYSVRWGVPFIYAVVAASAMPVLLPNTLTRGWLRNRRYIGLVFAVAMGWQGAFIFIMSNLHTGYYYDEVYYLRDELEGSSGYLFLAAMVLTSFRFGRQHLSAAQWKVLHRCGVYFLWAYPFSVYWWNLYYYGNAEWIDYVFYWAGYLAFAARIAAWGKRRARSNADWMANDAVAPRLLGWTLIALALVMSATAGYWREALSGCLLTPTWSATLELWLPFWPFEPFLSLAVLGIGTWLVTGGFAERPAAASRSGDKPATSAP